MERELFFEIPIDVHSQNTLLGIINLVPDSWTSVLGGLRAPVYTRVTPYVEGLHLSIEENGEMKLTQGETTQDMDEFSGLYQLMAAHKRVSSIGFVYAGSKKVIPTSLIKKLCNDLIKQDWVGRLQFSRDYFEREVREQEMLCGIKYQPEPAATIFATIHLKWMDLTENAIVMAPLIEFCRKSCREKTTV
jgi:spore cortex formation protein SpoVR/YcgB (stage V sporulation)